MVFDFILIVYSFPLFMFIYVMLLPVATMKKRKRRKKRKEGKPCQGKKFTGKFAAKS
jgi:hypothetical protein